MISKLFSSQPFYAKLSRSVALRVFLCFVLIEIVVLIPSYYRRKTQLLQTYANQAASTIQPWIGLPESELSVASRKKIIDRAITDSDLLGIEIFDASGQLLLAVGEEPSVSLMEWRRRSSTHDYDAERRVYETLITTDSLDANYFVLVRYDATELNQELVGYVLRIIGLIILIGVIVTLGTILTLHPKVLKPIYQLRNDLVLVGHAIAQDHEQPQMNSSIQNDELGEVVQVFHGFVGEIYSAIRDRKTVETELLSLNQALQVEIQHRQVMEEKLIEVNKQLQALAHSDGLTHVANRRYFDQCLEREWRRMARQKSPLSLIILDVDYFKQFNDHYGHQAGDHCLKQLAQASQDAVRRPGDFVARYGGEEFVVVLPDTNLAGAKVVAQNIRRAILALQLPHERSAVSPWVTVSMGISSQIPEPNSTPNTVISDADQALYIAKKQGRDRFCWGQPQMVA